MKHGEARAIVEQSCDEVLGNKTTPEAVQLAQAIGWLESKYGRAWTGAMLSSKNWGAMQCGGAWKGPYAVTRDSWTDKEGKVHWYESRYRVYGSDHDAAVDLVKLLAGGWGTRAIGALLRGDVEGFSRDLRAWRLEGGDPSNRLGYYEGSGATPAIRERNHRAHVWEALIRMETEIGGKLPGGIEVPPTLRPGATGLWVHRLRDALQLPAFGDFPAEQVKLYQEGHGLNADGIVGPGTWGMLFAELGRGLVL